MSRTMTRLPTWTRLTQLARAPQRRRSWRVPNAASRCSASRRALPRPTRPTGSLFQDWLAASLRFPMGIGANLPVERVLQVCLAVSVAAPRQNTHGVSGEEVLNGSNLVVHVGNQVGGSSFDSGCASWDQGKE
eukprot:2618973-Rhodomonas_salina.1